MDIAPAGGERGRDAAGVDLERGRGAALRHARIRHVRPRGPGPGRGTPRPARRGGGRARVRHRHRPGGRPALAAGNSRHGHRTVAAHGGATAHQGRRVDDPRDHRRHGDDIGPGRLHPGLPRLQHDLQPADPGRAGRVLSQRRPPPRPGRPLRGRTLGTGTARAPAGPHRHRLAVRARLHRSGHLRRPAPARRVAPLPLRRHHPGPPVPQSAPLHLARRTRPHGSTGRLPARSQTRGLARHPVHRRVPLARLRVPRPTGPAARPGGGGAAVR